MRPWYPCRLTRVPFAFQQMGQEEVREPGCRRYLRHCPSRSCASSERVRVPGWRRSVVRALSSSPKAWDSVPIGLDSLTGHHWTYLIHKHRTEKRRSVPPLLVLLWGLADAAAAAGCRRAAAEAPGNSLDVDASGCEVRNTLNCTPPQAVLI